MPSVISLMYVSARELVREADLVADRLAERRVELLRDARRHGARGDAARLRVADEAVHAAPELEADLRQLRRLAGARLAADDDDLVLARWRVRSPRAARRRASSSGYVGCGRFARRRAGSIHDMLCKQKGRHAPARQPQAMKSCQAGHLWIQSCTDQ